MKFKVNDNVQVTAGKDNGKHGKITKVFPKEDRVLVAGVNMYVKHVKPMQGRPGEKVRRERPLSTANVAIMNPDTGKVDRIGYKIVEGKKVRVFKKTGVEIK
ncbi:50S ribosomal protein L24 [Candidatus Cerribacteria bacterium 'Amazon FNV 2010 28 9']|uniref:Large ribosomal subunit protein uL24 n=1 Tax=Candidatus Cerribacteria bacterium 'Amazon FNV 2010 28 9' TaxID=2081795 RepID=A0A317JPQ1_9BACT|nr:MAG: 50S ribosomal protein L24 [Candidatus Cerribacteria bacterium 'Amazon FNV 2010 28 9']